MSLYFDNEKLFDAEGHLTDEGLYALKDLSLIHIYTARYAGINVRRVTVRTMLISGAICGLCGFLIVAGKDQTISTASANGRGFTAIIVAWLAKFNTFYMALISFLLVFLERGASEIASAYSLNEYAADIITGIILFFILGSEFFINYRVIPRGAHKEGK